MPIDPKYRIIAGFLGLVGLVALGVQTSLNLNVGPGGLAGVLWALAGNFTILTNVLVSVSFLRIAQSGNRWSFDWMSMLTLSMIAVGGIFHIALASAHMLEGTEWLTSHALHTIMPAATLWFWLTETTRLDPRKGRPPLWLIWPLGYAAYMLARGAVTGWYPYPFLDVSAFGAGQVALNVAVLVGLFVVLAFALNLLGRNMPLRSVP